MRMNLQPDQERNDWLDHLKNSSDMLLSNAEHFVLYKVRKAIHITPVVLATKALICLTCLGSRRMHSPCLRGEKALEVLPCEIRQSYRLAIHPRFRGLAHFLYDAEGLWVQALHPESSCLKVFDRRQIKILCNRAKARQGLINASHECTVSYEGIQHSTEKGQECALQDKNRLFSPRCFSSERHA